MNLASKPPDPFWLDATLAATVWLTVMALAMVGTRQPVRRRTLGRAAILGALALPTLVWFLPFPRWDGMAPWWFTHSPAKAPERLWESDQPCWPCLVPWLYLGCITLGACWLTLGGWAARRLTRRAAEPSAEARALMAALPFAACGSARPRLRVAACMSRPILVGLRRPTIVIPPDWDQPETQDQLRLALLHELAHAENRDHWFGLLGHLAQTVWFFVLPLWWIRHQMRIDQEFLADQRAAEQLGHPGGLVYASSLVELATRYPVGALQTSWNADAPPFDPGSPLVQRVAMLLRCPFPVEARPPFWWRLALPALAVLGILGVSGLTVGATSLYRDIRGASSQSEPMSSPGRFDLAELRLPATSVDATPLPFPIPIRLPERYELSLQVFADDAALPETRIAGIRLADGPPRASLRSAGPSWFDVRIVRDDEGNVLWINGVPVENDFDAEPLAWLSVQPAPGQPALFRNLTLRW